MQKVEIPIQYRGLDFVLTITDYTDEVEILEYEIELDYAFGNPHPFDGVARMIIATLKDGDHLAAKVLDFTILDSVQWERVCDAVLVAIGDDKRDYTDGIGDYTYEQLRDDMI